MLKLIFIVMIFAIVGCKGKAKESYQDGDFKIELLFEKDSCKVYRFRDAGRNIYWSDCRGRIQYGYTTRSGKTSTTHHVETMNN